MKKTLTKTEKTGTLSRPKERGVTAMRGFWLLLLVGVGPAMAMLYGVEYLVLHNRPSSAPIMGATLVAHP